MKPTLLILTLLICVPSLLYSQSKAELKRDIEELNAKVNALMADADADGTSDYFDREPNTPQGTPDDNLGVSLDSDKDGCPDSEDPEPYSSPLLPLEDCKDVYITSEYVKDLVYSRDMSSGSGSDMMMIMVNIDIKPVQGQRYLIDEGFYNKYIAPKSDNVKAVKELLAKPAYKIFDITAYAAEFPHYTGRYVLVVISGDKYYSSPVTLLKGSEGKTLTFDFTRR